MNKKLLIIISVVVLVLGGGGAYYFLVMAKETPPIEETEAVATEPEEVDGPMMEPFTVNLANPGGRRYLRCKLQLKLYNDQALEHLEKNMSQLRDAALLHLSSKTTEDILGAEGKIALREEMLAQLNTLLAFETGKGITQLYFTEFLVQ